MFTSALRKITANRVQSFNKLRTYLTKSEWEKVPPDLREKAKGMPLKVQPYAFCHGHMLTFLDSVYKGKNVKPRTYGKEQIQSLDKLKELVSKHGVVNVTGLGIAGEDSTYTKDPNATGSHSLAIVGQFEDEKQKPYFLLFDCDHTHSEESKLALESLADYLKKQVTELSPDEIEKSLGSRALLRLEEADKFYNSIRPERIVFEFGGIYDKPVFTVMEEVKIPDAKKQDETCIIL
jgi:hypothetical protein